MLEKRFMLHIYESKIIFFFQLIYWSDIFSYKQSQHDRLKILQICILKVKKYFLIKVKLKFIALFTMYMIYPIYLYMRKYFIFIFIAEYCISFQNIKIYSTYIHSISCNYYRLYLTGLTSEGHCCTISWINYAFCPVSLLHVLKQYNKCGYMKQISF